MAASLSSTTPAGGASSLSSPPVRIEGYRLSKTLGIGSFGKVKLAIHEKTGYKVRARGGG